MDSTTHTIDTIDTIDSQAPAVSRSPKSEVRSLTNGGGVGSETPIQCIASVLGNMDWLTGESIFNTNTDTNTQVQYPPEPKPKPEPKTESRSRDRESGLSQDLQPEPAPEIAPAPAPAPAPKYDKKTHKRCIKCREAKPKIGNFGKHNTADGYQQICYACKNIANKRKREQDATTRIRHHISTRCLTQLGKHAPEKFTANLEEHLGYSIFTLVEHLRADLKAREGSRRTLKDALQEGYHIDHIMPLHSFKVIVADGSVDWEVFRDCWRIENLSAIPAAENLAKGGKILESDVSSNECRTPGATSIAGPSQDLDTDTDTDTGTDE